MVLEAKMRHIGIASNQASLHPLQSKVLKKAQNPDVKVMALVGGMGSGKTILATEVVKIWMAQHNEKYKVYMKSFESPNHILYSSCYLLQTMDDLDVLVIADAQSYTYFSKDSPVDLLLTELKDKYFTDMEFKNIAFKFINKIQILKKWVKEVDAKEDSSISKEEQNKLFKKWIQTEVLAYR